MPNSVDSKTLENSISILNSNHKAIINIISTQKKVNIHLVEDYVLALFAISKIQGSKEINKSFPKLSQKFN